MKQTYETTISPPQQTQDTVKKSGVVSGVLIGTLMMGFGLLAAFAPVATGLSLAYVITAGLGIYGATQLAAWVRAGRQRRNGWTLGGGILLTGFSLFTLWSALQTSYGTVVMISALATVAAFFTVLMGIGQFFTFDELRTHGTEGAGWVLTSGILNVILGIVLLTNPIASWFALSAVWGIYLSVSGLALLVESISGRRGVRGDV
ncbi:HdeD family acid-resistance protein [uncultured Ruthenibacterium sp.]|mgnify:CR=1 FL=1|uniref:HdeD family acid-resistance protein n=1 Tax=uncultured Ruthenibacterium sp. TaxID=1905347 RepID=UPI00349E7FAC